MKIKYRLSFSLRAYGKKTIRYQIRLRVTYYGDRLDIVPGWSLDSPEYWDEGTQTVRHGYVGIHGEKAADINADLAMVKSNVELSFMFFEANDIIPTPSELLDKYKERIGGIIPKKPKAKEEDTALPPINLFTCFDEFIDECSAKNAWTEATTKKMQSLLVDLKSFDHKLTFDSLSEKKLTSFVIYLRDQKVLHTPRKKKEDREEDDIADTVGLRNTTIGKKLGYLKWFLQWAANKGYNTNNSYKTFKPSLKSTQKKVIYLTKEELARIKNFQFDQKTIHLEPVRDVFLFCCFSGLRHSDAYNLRRSDVKEDHIEVTTVKTADSISIELNSVTKEILKRYADVPLKDNRALPVFTNQAMNRYLKELCRLAGIDDEIRITTYKGNERLDEIKHKWELVGTHTGRRTFIVNALSLGIPPNIVMKWTGHSDYKAMKPYIDIVDSIKADSMTKFDGLF
ncbi:MAG: phage integrase SAM-like domain-containing protein [Bacteroidales bacterium]|nr:phage integrase SAM-like domain-containing protein [Candidatus Cryptobacteroides onthequi]